jgi:hypothetical protein
MPWIVMAVVVLLVVIGIIAYFATQRSGVTVSIEGTPTANPVAKPASPGPPPTLAAPTLPPSQPTTTPAPTPTAAPTTTPPPAPTAPPPTAAPKPAAQQASPVAAAPAPTAAAPAQPAQPTPPSQPTPPPSPTPFAGQVSNAGGIGNTRADLQTALGAPAGETPEHLVVFRKDNLEYHVDLAPDLNGRVTLIVEIPQQPMTLEAAMAEARKMLPRDVQPPSPQPEGNDQFVAQRFTSQMLAQALGAEPFAAVQAQPGEMLAVYARDAGGRITRIVVGIGSDPSALLNRGR